MNIRSFATLAAVILCVVFGVLRFQPSAAADEVVKSQRLLYVAAPGIRDYLQYGGHGVLVFDIDHGHKFVRRGDFGAVTSSR